MLVLSEQHARMAVPAVAAPQPDSAPAEISQRRIEALEALVKEKDQVGFPSPKHSLHASCYVCKP